MLPIANNDAIQEPSSIVILPDDSGVSFDMSKSMVGDDQPITIP